MSSTFRKGFLATTVVSMLAGAVSAQDGRSPVEPKSLPLPDQKVEEVKPNVEQIDETKFRIGKITFDKKTREIRVPTRVNMVDGLLEFLLVHQNGKVHESLLVTDASATNLNLAFTLLRYKPSRELYALTADTGGLSNEFPEVDAETKRAARFDIDVEPVQFPQIGQGKHEERPLIPFKVDPDRERQCGDRLESPRVQQFDPDVDVAIRLRPVSFLRMDPMPFVARCVDGKDLFHIGPVLLSLSLTAPGCFELRRATCRDRSRVS